MTRDSLVKAMEGHFRRTVEEYSNLSFPETKVQMPTASFERYADAILEAHAPKVEWSVVGDFTSWDPDPATGSAKVE